jgi:sigma-B regulation protein RsbU (phosphoserine phosphatase)
MTIQSETPVVLLVDDQLIIGEAVRRILAADPTIRFHFCSKGAEALATAAKLQPTVILQDLLMPDADGLELVKGYRQQEATRLTPLIVLSSKEEGSTKADAFARGANDYIVKLPDPVELLARVRYHSQSYLSLLQRNAAFEALRKSEATLAGELAKAAHYVRSLLPAPLAGDVQIDWRFTPSASLGGDCLDYFWIDDDHLAIYLLDACGHGVGPALLGVSAMNTVRSSSGTGADLRDPSSVLGRLNAAFPMAHHGGMFFTIWYGVYQKSTRSLTYSGGGHPPPLLITPDRRVQKLDSPSPPIGIIDDLPFEPVRATVEPGSSLLIYSDGAIEIFTGPGKLWGINGLTEFMLAQPTLAPPTLDALVAKVLSIHGSPVLADDFSAILAAFP